MRQFGHDQPIPAACDTYLDLHRLQLRGNDHTYWVTEHATNVEMVSKYHVSLQRNPACCDTRKFGHHSAGVDKRMMTSLLQEVDDMITGVLEGPPSSLTQYTSVMRKFQTIIRRCMVSNGGMLGCTPSQHDIQHTFTVQPMHHCPWEPVLEHGARGVKRGTRRLLGCRVHPSSYVPLDPFDSLDLDAQTFSLGLAPFAPLYLSATGTSYILPDPFDSLDIDYVLQPPSAGDMSYAPPHPCAVGLSFDASPPPSTTDSSVLHMLISRAFSSDSDDHGDDPSDDVIPAKQLVFGHRVRSKTTRFTPSDYR
ncbi:hypothetical protein M9H77_14342 [Catharanthus roseus]|uniref:Uncharacterized protein n=1 Tax=Catharanthus roseus TaxID=4058 RepID=A0ACC0BN06_CATRO|nr:hypothetical protein M9H77_14342 [Catharanthus roseus]